jgi:hypothetical protein
MSTDTERFNNINNFLNYIINYNIGYINSTNHKNYINAINYLTNNGSIEIKQYEEFMNNTKLKFPSIEKLNEWKKIANLEITNNIQFFCNYLWMYLYH